MKVVLYDFTKKVLSIFLAFIIAIPLISIPNTAYAASFSDIRDHWAASYINKAVSYGFVKGYPDGTFKPDNAVSRAEFTSMVNKALGNTASTSVGFKDVPYNEWYYNDVAKGISAAFVGGYDDNTFRPNTAVTREEAAVMIARFVPTYGSSGNVSAFKDRVSISSWASDAVARIYGKGYMGAYDDGKYHPQDSLTRAQTAKILCSILDKETIVSSSTIIKSKGTTLSNRIYTNNVTMHSDLGTGEAELSNCVVLGNLYVYGGGDNSIIVSNSRVANAYVEKSSSSVRLLAKGQTTINKTTVGNTAILETSGLSGGINGTGFSDVDIKGSADATLRGSFVKVNLVGSSADVEVESGAITTFNVTSSGRNSEVNLNNRASIGTANVDAAVAFKGSGSINTMNVNSNNVTYETKPRYVKLGSGIKTPGYTDDDDDYDISVDPKHKATKVKVNTDITLTFKTAVTKYNGSTIRDSDIPDMIYLRKNSSSGSRVSLTGSINSSKKVITLTPKSDLDEDTKYYVVIDKNEFLDSRDKGNSAQTTYFTTGDESDGTVRFSPKNGASDISRNVSPTITFSQSIETYNGKSITSSYLDDSVIIFRENNSSGSRVSFRASINSSKKTITIEPRSNLKEGQKYYLAIASRKLRTQSGSNNIGSSSVTWTVTSPSAPTVSFSPSNNAVNVNLNTNITMQFSSAIYTTSSSTPTSSYITGNINFRNDSTGASVPYNLVSYGNNGSGYQIIIRPTEPLKPGISYTVSVIGSRFKNSSGTYVSGSSSTFRAIGNVDFSKLDTAINAANSAKSGIRVSANGSDIYTNVYWVTQQALDTLNNAINAAVNAKSTATTTALADNAANILNSAVSAFNSAKALGTKVIVDTSAIDTALNNATNALSDVAVSVDGYDIDPNKYWVTQDVMNAYNAAINKAKSAKDTVSNVNQAFDAAMELEGATTTFKSSRTRGSKADKSSLDSALRNARNNILATATSVDGSDILPSNKWVSSSDKSTYKTAIDNAGNVSLAYKVSQSEVDSALSTLNDATNAFNSAKRDGTLVTPPEGGTNTGGSPGVDSSSSNPTP